MTNSLPKVYISILNWNCYEQSIACLHSLERLDYPNVEIILVDNNSRDDSVRHIRTVFPDLRIIESPENLGYAGGNRLALEVALQEDADLFWILNPDVIVQPESLSALVDAYLRRGPGLYGSLPLSSADPPRIGITIRDTYRDEKVDFSSKRFRGQTVDEAFPDRQPKVVAKVSGSSMMIPLEVVRQYGFMDESFFLYSEETDYCLRMAKQGIPSTLVPTSVVIHIGRETTQNPVLHAVMRYYGRRNRLIMIRRHGCFCAFLKAAIEEIGRCWKTWVKMLLFPARFAATPPSTRYMCIGVFDGLLNRMGKTIAPEDFLDEGPG